MRKLRWIILLLAAGAVTLVVARLIKSAPGEGPISHEQHLSYWVDTLGRVAFGKQSVNSIEVSNADEAITHIGAEAFPYLLKWIQSEHPPAASKLSPWMNKLFSRYPSIERLFVSQHDIRIEGTGSAFALLRTNIDSPAIEALVRLMNDSSAPRTAYRATAVLGGAGPQALPALAKVLENPKHPMRWLAVRLVLFQTAPASPDPLVPGLINCLTDHTRDTSAIAASALARRKAPPQLAVPALVGCLASASAPLRNNAAKSLASFEGQASIALPALTNLFTDALPEVRQTASNSVATITAWLLTNTTPR